MVMVMVMVRISTNNNVFELHSSDWIKNFLISVDMEAVWKITYRVTRKQVCIHQFVWSSELLLCPSSGGIAESGRHASEDGSVLGSPGTATDKQRKQFVRFSHYKRGERAGLCLSGAQSEFLLTRWNSKKNEPPARGSDNSASKFHFWFTSLIPSVTPATRQWHEKKTWALTQSWSF